MPWLEVSLEIPASKVEPCSTTLEELGACSVSFFDAGDVPLLEPLPGTTPLWDKVKIVGLFEQGIDMSSISQALTIFSPVLPTIIPLPEQDWCRTWLTYFKPMQFGQHLWVVPHGQDVPPDLGTHAVVLKLDPGLAFGTGTHPTTALCLEWLDKHPPYEHRVIDYGCGSGILGMAALLLGALKVVAIDYDPQALLSTRENATRNDLTLEKLITFSPEQYSKDQERAHTILANILAKPLISLASTLQGHCVLGGHIVLSGLLTTQIEEVQTAYEPWFSFEEVHTKEEWALLVGKRV